MQFPDNTLLKHLARSALCKLQSLLNPLGRAQFCDLEALLKLQRFDCSRLPWTGSALRPSALLLCLHEIEIHRRLKVIELGSGVSTIFFAKLLQQLGGHLLTIDHNKEWQDIVAARCHDCLDSVTFATTPLQSVTVEESKFEWYAPDTIRKCAADYQADMMVVDGPIGNPCQMARYPAMPVLRHCLAEDFTVILDDINRREELLTAKSWADKYNLSLSVTYARGNVGILRPHSTLAKYNIF
jgi:hypothetical protein